MDLLAPCLLIVFAVFLWWIWREDPLAVELGQIPDWTERERVLFLCTHNSARSQMAEALLRKTSEGRFYVASAGTEPTQVHPLAVRVMAEIGVSLGHQRSKGLAEVGNRWDYVITLCDTAYEQCPELPPKTSRLHWPLKDPSGVEGSLAQRTEAFRRVRDDLVVRVREWVSERRESL